MQENFLHYVWQHQYFDLPDLQTTNGESLIVTNSGILNQNAGPDFSNAHLILQGVKWAGNVEIHVKASAWYQHNHYKDQSYDNVILHVVWENDCDVHRTDGSIIPAFELKGRVDTELIHKWTSLVNSEFQIPCAGQISQVDEIARISMMDKVLMSRLERKAEEIVEVFKSTNNDWEETAYRILAKNLGFKINAQPFEQLAQSISINILRKHSNSRLQMEALLFGQAGMLNKNTSDYQQELEYEYRFLAHKYNLLTKQVKLEQWKFAKLRPVNFPTIRIAQLASILQENGSIFSSFLELESISQATTIFKIPTSTFWQNHYRFDSISDKIDKTLGRSSIENIVINTVIPLMVAYGKYIGEQHYIDRAIGFLEGINSENNRIIRKWKEVGINVKSAFDSQALIELANNYCGKKRCLSCKIGNQIVSKKEIQFAK